MTIEDQSFSNMGAGRHKTLVRTRSGLVIGCAAKPRMPALSTDAEAIQAALLAAPVSGRWYARMWRAFWRWC